MLNIIGVFQKLSPGLIVLGWSVIIAALTLAQVFQGHLIPSAFYGGVTNQLISDPEIFYLEVLGVSAFAGLVIQDPGRAIISFIVSYAIAVAITSLVLMLPVLVDTTPVVSIVFGVAVVDTFTALFPFPLLIGIIGTIVGLGLAERFL